MPHLFSPIKIKSIEFKNRLGVSPMCEYSSEDGFANDWHLVHLGSRAIGGAALVFSEATAVSPEGRITASDLGIYKDEHVTKLKQITDFIHQHGAVRSGPDPGRGAIRAAAAARHDHQRRP